MRIGDGTGCSFASSMGVPSLYRVCTCRCCRPTARTSIDVLLALPTLANVVVTQGGRSCPHSIFYNQTTISELLDCLDIGLAVNEVNEALARPQKRRKGKQVGSSNGQMFLALLSWNYSHSCGLCAQPCALPPHLYVLPSLHCSDNIRRLLW